MDGTTKTIQRRGVSMERLTTRHNGVAVIKDKSKHKEAMEKIKRWDDEVITRRLS